MASNGKVALVTGAAKRVGRSIALELADAGYDVVIHYLTSVAEAEETAEIARSLGVRSLAIRADVLSVPELESLVGEVLNQFGRLDVLVNNASAFFATTFGATTEHEWDGLIDSNLKGPYFLSQLAVAAIKIHDEGGHIINITDVSPERPWVRYLPYCAAKAGLISLTKGMARALAPNVRVNAVSPGPVLFPESYDRDQKERARKSTLLGREGSPEDIAKTVRFLIEGSDFITGAVVPVDGGRSLI